MTHETYKDDLLVAFADQAAWREWLAANHDKQGAVWIKIAKKDSGVPSVTRDQALDEALCFGWIDAIAHPLDDKYYLQKYTKRRPKGTWSKRNVGKIAQLTAAGKMHQAGIAEVEAAKADGRWDMAYDSPTNMTMPQDFKVALEANPKAKAFYDTLNKTNVYAFLWRIQTAKRPETRQNRIAKFIAMLEQGETFH